MTPQRKTKHSQAVQQARLRSGGICERCGWPAQTYHHEQPADRLMAAVLRNVQLRMEA